MTRSALFTKPWLDDGDVRLYHGDALDVLRGMPDEGQLGLEESPEQFVAAMVAVFREVRRVLAPHGTCFLNIGDSFYSSAAKGGSGPGGKNEARWSYGRAARRDARESDTAYTAPQGSPDLGSACLDLCGECAASLSHHNGHTGQPHPESAWPASPTARDNERADSALEPPAASPRDAQASTSPESDAQPPVSCWRCGIRPASVSLPFARPSEFDAPVSAHTEQSRHGTTWTSPSLADRTSGMESSALASLYSTIAARRLKPKDAVLIPQILALALQLDGWYVRSEIIWAKKNCMPESVTDRPTKSHETIWLLTKQPRYWFDQEAVREPQMQSSLDRLRSGWNGNKERDWPHGGHNNFDRYMGKTDEEIAALPGRNIRSVWTIATQPYPEAHFATFPEELARRCILAGCPEWVCKTCGKARERIVDVSYEKSPVHGAGSVVGRHYETGANNFDGAGMPRLNKRVKTTGFTHCAHSTRPENLRPGLVLDPFVGSGTVAKVARDHCRHTIGIDLNADYLALAARRLQQLSLLTGGAA